MQMKYIILLLLIALSLFREAIGQQQGVLYWAIQEDAAFQAETTFTGPNNVKVAVLPGRSLLALTEAKRRIGDQFGVRPKLVISSQQSVNAFATDTPEGAMVSVNIATIFALKDDPDLWAALLGHELAHVYHHHVADHKLRASLLSLASAVLDAYQQKKGRDRTDLINFGAMLVDNTFTRDQEREADSTGTEYMIRAGYNPEGAIRLQQLLMRLGGASGFSFLQSHPGGEERIQIIRQKIARRSGYRPQQTLTATEFNRWLMLCDSENRKNGIQPSNLFEANNACLEKQNSEMAKRYVLCSGVLNSRRGSNTLADYVNCAVTNYDETRFSYIAWNGLCSLHARKEASEAAEIRRKAEQCIVSNAPADALRGFLCESEILAVRTPSADQRNVFSQCAAESAPLSSRFVRADWKNACHRKAVLSSDISEFQKDDEQTCMQEAPADEKHEPIGGRSPLTAQQILSEVTDTLGRLKSAKAIVPNECDRITNIDVVHDLPVHSIGFIDAGRGEPACKAALKSPTTIGRAQIGLAAIAIQSGRYEDALNLAQLALKSKAMNAASIISGLNANGHTGPIDNAKNIDLLLSEVKRGSSLAINDLARMVNAGDGVDSDPEVAFQLSKIALGRGLTSAKWQVAEHYLSGQGTNKNIEEAFRLFSELQDDVPMALLPIMSTLQRKSGEQDKAAFQRLANRAKSEAERFAAMGSLAGLQMLAMIYQHGLGVPADQIKSVQRYAEVAKFGFASANIELGYAYLNGAGVEKNREKALELFGVAAAKGSLQAQNLLARLKR